MTRLIRLISLFLFLAVFSYGSISEVVFKSSGITTNYMNIMQNEAIQLKSDDDTLTINIGDKIVVIYTPANQPTCTIVQGFDLLDSFSGGKYGSECSLNFKIKWQNSFIQDGIYSVTINSYDGSNDYIYNDNLTYNEQFVVNTFNITCDSKYMYLSPEGTWFKGGIGSAEQLHCSGKVTYKYNQNIYPLQDVSARIFFDNKAEGSVVNINTSGLFDFNNFVLPTSASISRNVELKINLVFPQGNATIDNTVYINTKNIMIDNQAPAINGSSFQLLPDLSDNGGDGILPETGWYDQLTVSVKINNLATDNTGSGVRSQFYYESIVQSLYSSSNVTVSIKTLEGTDREIVVYLLDNVYNYVTMSITVNVDQTLPGTFYVTIADDTDNNPTQSVPEQGWYNDETVSFSWTQPSDTALKDQPYQIKSDVGWPYWSAQIGDTISINQFQSTMNANALYIEPGNNTNRTVYVRAADKAGNVREAYANVKVDIQPPTINYLLLMDDTNKADGQMLPEKGWYNDGSEVRWMWSVSDGGALPNQPFAYRNTSGLNSTTSNWTNISDVMVGTSESLTGNEFVLIAKDAAGNIQTTSGIVYVSETPISFNFVDINFLPDDSDNQNDGVLPNANWYDQSTLNIVLTWDIDSGGAGLSRLYLKTDKDVSYSQNPSSNPTFSEFTVIPQDNTPIIFTALFVDKAGWTKSINKYIKADVTTPSNLNITLVPDADSNGDGIDPEPGWYDDDTIDLSWQQPIDGGKLRDKPYRIKINNNGWGNWQAENTVANFKVSANIRNEISIECADEAGNIVTNSVFVTVDVTLPTGSYTLKLEDDGPHRGGVTPDLGWYSDNYVFCSFISENVTDSLGLRSAKYFIKNDLGKTTYGQGFTNSKDVSIYTTEGGSLTHYIVGAIADHAGNVLQKTTNVYVDMVNPASFYANILADNTDSDGNGYLSESGWYDNEQINLEWNQSNDDGQLPAKPYRLKSVTTQNWTDWQNELAYNGLGVLEGGDDTRDAYIQVRDKAGNLTTKNLYIKIDKTPPIINTFDIIAQSPIVDTDIPNGVVLPLPGWFSQTVITLSWDVPIENGQLRDAPYKYKASTGQVDYSDFTSQLTATLSVSANNHDTINVLLFALDRAGNGSIATREIKVDVSAPTVTLSYSIARSFIKPFLITSDIVSVTLQLSEEVTITPMLGYYYLNSPNLETFVNLMPAMQEWFCTFNVSSLEDGWYIFKTTVFDNAGNKTTSLNGDSYFIIKTSSPPQATNFRMYNPLTEDQYYTKLDQVKVTFNVDSQVKKYWITEEATPNLDITNFSDYPTTDYYYTFDSQKNETKLLYLWVANDLGIISSESVTCSIYYDTTEPLVRIQPDEVGSQGLYSNVIVPKGLMTAKMEVSNKLAYQDPAYIEAAIVTPFWQVLLPGLYSTVTVDLTPVLPETMSNPLSSNYRTVWLATYNTNLAEASGNAYFRIGITDNALNYTDVIFDGATFNVNIDAATNPGLYIYSLDQRTEYTRWLTVNLVISKDSSLTNYDYYRVIDGSYNTPLATEVNNPWPAGENKITLSYRIDNGTAVENALEGPKSLYVWTRKSLYINPGIVKKVITFDITIPTYSMQTDLYKQKDNLNYTETLRVTINFNEKMCDNPTPTIYIINEDEITTISSYELVFLKLNKSDYVYITTINVEGSDKQKNIYIKVIGDDMAGNRLIAREALRQKLVLQEYKDEVSIKQPYAEQGQKDFAFMSFTVSANDKPVHLKGIRILAYGHYVASDISQFTIYKDGDDNGLFEPRKKYDVIVGVSDKELDNTHVVYIPFYEDEIIVSSNKKKFFVAADIGAGAVKGNTMYLQYATKNVCQVNDNEMVDYSIDPYNTFKTKTVTFVKPISRVYINNMDDSDLNPTFNQGADLATIKKLKLYTDVGSVVWSGMKISYTGSLDNSNFSQIAIYKDGDYNGIFNKDIDVLISNGNDRFESGKNTITVNFKINQALTNESDNDTYYIVGAVGINAPIGTTFSMRIVTANDIYIETPNIVVDSSFPVNSIPFNIQKYTSKIDVTHNNNKQEDVYQGDRIVLQKFNLTVDYFNPKLRSIDYLLDGTAIKSDFNDIAIYTLSRNQTYNSSYFELTDASKLDAVNTWMDSDKKVRIQFANPYELSSSNSFALVATVSPTANIDKQFVFRTTYYITTANPYVIFQNGTAKADKTITTNTVLIIDAFRPSQPIISGNYYSQYVQKIGIDYDSYTKNGNNIVGVKYYIGSTKEGTDIATYTEKALATPRSLLIDEPLNIENIILEDNKKYFIMLNTISERTDNPSVKYYSKTSYFEFKTDFSPPHLPNYPPSVVISDTDVNNITHQITWGDFLEEESGIGKFIVEEKSNYSPSWSVVKENYISDPASIKSSDRLAVMYNRKPNMSYTYRIKAQNLAGLLSDYIYTNSVTTVETNKVLSHVSNYPNPFYSRKEKTKLFYFLNQDTGIEIKVYDSIGHFVKKFTFTGGLQGKSVKGDCEVEWDGKDEAGEYVEKGGYFVVIEAPEAKGEVTKVVRMVGVVH
ncbi:MAG: hypothetical protein PHV30_00725 [Candidatus Margulisbacteria bacterium]|nr:hypothetical protein [Candidatus Margulisiibacteriota bacterium]